MPGVYGDATLSGGPKRYESMVAKSSGGSSHGFPQTPVDTRMEWSHADRKPNRHYPSTEVGSKTEALAAVPKERIKEE